jgi:hypothetical protein
MIATVEISNEQGDAKLVWQVSLDYAEPPPRSEAPPAGLLQGLEFLTFPKSPPPFPCEYNPTTGKYERPGVPSWNRAHVLLRKDQQTYRATVTESGGAGSAFKLKLNNCPFFFYWHPENQTRVTGRLYVKSNAGERMHLSKGARGALFAALESAGCYAPLTRELVTQLEDDQLPSADQFFQNYMLVGAKVGGALPPPGGSAPLNPRPLSNTSEH